MIPNNSFHANLDDYFNIEFVSSSQAKTLYKRQTACRLILSTVQQICMEQMFRSNKRMVVAINLSLDGTRSANGKVSVIRASIQAPVACKHPEPDSPCIPLQNHTIHFKQTAEDSGGKTK